MIAYFNKFKIEMTKIQAETCSHSGDCEPEVINLLKMPSIKRQMAKCRDVDLKAELSEYGAWEENELDSREENEKRIIWIAAGNIADGSY